MRTISASSFSGPSPLYDMRMSITRFRICMISASWTGSGVGLLIRGAISGSSAAGCCGAGEGDRMWTTSSRTSGVYSWFMSRRRSPVVVVVRDDELVAEIKKRPASKQRQRNARVSSRDSEFLQSGHVTFARIDGRLDLTCTLAVDNLVCLSRRAPQRTDSHWCRCCS